MAVVFDDEIAGARSATNSEGSRSYTRAFRLYTTATSDSPYAVGSHASLPVIGSPHPKDPLATCKEISVKNTDPWKGWTVTVKYDDKRDIDENDPENDEVLVSCTSDITQETLVRDINGDKILNSAGDYFTEPVPTRDAARLVFKIESNHKTIPAWATEYHNAVNVFSFTIMGLTFSSFSGRVSKIDIGNREKRGDTTFYPVSTEIVIAPDSNTLNVLDQGFRERDTANKHVQLKNPKDDELPSHPILLDGAGKRLADPTPETAVFKSFATHPLKLFRNVLPGVT